MKMTGDFSIPVLLFACLATLVVSDPDVEYFGPSYVEEGSTFVVKCHLSGSARLKWTKNYTNVNGPEFHMTMKTVAENEVESQLTVRGAHANHTGNYRCEIFTPKFHSVSVVYGLAADVNDSVHILDLDKDNTIVCNVSGAEMKIKWYKDRNLVNTSDAKRYAVDNANLTIKAASYSDAGTYVCSIENISSNQTIIVRTRARVEKLPKSINLVEGERLNLTCIVFGNPLPTVEWRKDDVPVKELNTTTVKLLPNYHNVTDATLLIEQLEFEDRGLYMCFVANDVNEANQTVMIRVKDKLAALWPFLGIVAEVAILCTIIFIYEKRRAKQEYEESDTDQNNESKPVADQKEKDVRQRK